MERIKKISLLRPVDKLYVLRLKSLIFISALLFAASLVSGYLSSVIFPELPEKILGNFDDLVQKIIELSNPELFLFIFSHNALKIMAAVILGVFLGLIPLIFILTNGFVVGLVAFYAFQSSGPLVFWMGIIPHGIFEIPALILGVSAGFFLGDIAYKKAFAKKERFLKEEIIKALRFFLRVILPLIFIAAFVEVYLTPHIIDFFR